MKEKREIKKEKRKKERKIDYAIFDSESDEGV